MKKQKRDILILDDDPDVRTLVKKVLETAGMSTYEAASVKEALALLDKRVPHLIICDLMMPDQTGFDFLEQRRKIPALNTTPVLVLSALSDRDSVFKAMSLGATDYALKPFESTILLQKVHKALRDHRFPVFRAASSNGYKTMVKVPATVVMASEVGFMLEAPVKIAPETAVQVQAPILEELGLSSCLLRSTDHSVFSARARSSGQYINEISAIGVPETTAAKIRKTIRTWS